MTACHLTLNCLTLKSKTLCYFRKLETTHQTKQHHVLEVLNLQVFDVFLQQVDIYIGFNLLSK